MLDGIVQESVLPKFSPGKALRGVFLGNEICCENVTCWGTALARACAWPSERPKW